MGALALKISCWNASIFCLMFYVVWGCRSGWKTHLSWSLRKRYLLSFLYLLRCCHVCFLIFSLPAYSHHSSSSSCYPLFRRSTLLSPPVLSHPDHQPHQLLPGRGGQRWEKIHLFLNFQAKLRFSRSANSHLLAISARSKASRPIHLLFKQVCPWSVSSCKFNSDVTFTWENTFFASSLNKTLFSSRSKVWFTV